MGLLDSILGQVGGQSANSTTSGSGGGAAALMPALMAIMAAKSGGGTGGLGALGGMLGGAGASASGGNGMGGMLGSLMGGAQGGQAGGLGSMLGGGGIAGGLGQLLQSFEQNGHGTAAQCWVSDGANASVSPEQVGQALGPDTIAQLASHTGMSQGDVMSHLSQVLPQAVHQLTPNGRLPTSDEASQWV
ncbi:MAG: YidB family protein [Janthinobacterium lividum]